MDHQFRNYQTKLWPIDNDDDTLGKLVPANLLSVCQSGCCRTPASKHHIIIMTINVRSLKILSPIKKGWIAIALLLMLEKAFDNVKIEKLKVKVV